MSDNLDRLTAAFPDAAVKDLPNGKTSITVGTKTFLVSGSPLPVCWRVEGARGRRIGDAGFFDQVVRSIQWHVAHD